MLYLIPAPAHRVVLRLAHRVRRRWWYVRRPRLSGCRVLAFDREGRVLLVRHSYGTGAWMPPGGGLQAGEDPLNAAQRELLEETGCTLQWAAHIELAEEQLHGAGNSVHVIVGDTLDPPLADGRIAARAQHRPHVGRMPGEPRFHGVAGASGLGSEQPLKPFGRLARQVELDGHDLRRRAAVPTGGIAGVGDGSGGWLIRLHSRNV